MNTWGLRTKSSIHTWGLRGSLAQLIQSWNEIVRFTGNLVRRISFNVEF